MTSYRYGTLLRVLNDDPHPENDVEEGDYHIKAGKHEDGDRYEVMAPGQLAAVELETVAVYGPSETPMSARQAQEFVREQAIADPEVDV